MTIRKISPEANKWLDNELIKYRKNIISQVPFINDEHEITIQELMKAKYEVDDLYSKKQYINVKNNRFKLIFVVTISFFTTFVSIIYYVIANNAAVKELKNWATIVAIASIILLILVVSLSLYLHRTKKHIQEKNIINIFMDNWNELEFELKQKFTSKDTSKSLPWIDVMQMYLKESDENYPEKAQNFYYVLNTRNKIVHGEQNSINYTELLEAIKLLSKLTSNIKHK